MRTLTTVKAAAAVTLTAVTLALLAAIIGLATRPPTVDPNVYTDRSGGTWACTVSGQIGSMPALTCDGIDRLATMTSHREVEEILAVDEGGHRVHFFDRDRVTGVDYVGSRDLVTSQ